MDLKIQKLRGTVALPLNRNKNRKKNSRETYDFSSPQPRSTVEWNEKYFNALDLGLKHEESRIVAWRRETKGHLLLRRGRRIHAEIAGHTRAVVAAADIERGNVVKAFIVLNDGHVASDILAKELQDFVKAAIAPFKYPRRIQFIDALPKTQTGKIQRFKLRED